MKAITNAPAKAAAHFKLTTAWPKLLAGSAMVAFVGGLLLVQLGSLVGPSATELHTIATDRSLSSLNDNLLLAPYKLLVYLLLQLPGSDLLHVRLASVILTCLSIWLLFTLARRWYGTTNSIWVSIAFAASTWTLQIGRFGAAYSLIILTVLGLLNLASWIQTTREHNKALITYALACGLALFTPGGIWFVLAITVLLYKPLLIHRTKAKPQQLAIAAGIFVALFVGIGSSLAQNMSTLAQWVGLPDQFPPLTLLLKQLAGSVSYVVLRGPVLQEFWLAHTPVLDVACSVFLIFGVIFYTRHLRNSRTKLLLSFASISVVLIALNGAAALNYLVPIVYLVLGGGLAYVMHQWNRVFPNNPIARTMAVLLVSGLLLAVVGFHTIRYFVAWHYSPDTAQAYGRQSTDSQPDKITTHLIQ